MTERYIYTDKPEEWEQLTLPPDYIIIDLGKMASNE